MSTPDRRALTLYVGLFLLGVGLGLAQLAADLDQPTPRQNVATANWVHVGIALAAAAALLVAARRYPARLRAFLARPFSERMWRALVQALVGVPRLAQLPRRLLSLLAAVLLLYCPLRAGQQVFAALDPDFTRNAWGGPSYLGASVAHWLDLVLICYASAAALCWLDERARHPVERIDA